MEIARTYKQPSIATSNSGGMGFSLATDLSRPNVFLNANVKDGLSFSRAMLVLHSIVCTNMARVPKDYSAYQEWLQGEYLKELPEVMERKNLQGLMAEKDAIQQKIAFLETEIRKNPITKSNEGYYEAQSKFWHWLGKTDHKAWIVLDPVVSVQPDAVFFEAFSLDESMYGRITLPNTELELVDPLQRGTTNIDFSEKLAIEFDRVRTYRPLRLQVGQDSVQISTELASSVEKKIDLPETWVKGFLEVQSASALVKIRLNLSPATVADLLAILEQKKDNVSPKSLKFLLHPGKKPVIEIEPWGILLQEQEHLFEGSQSHTYRIWGRRRLMVLKDILPHASKVELQLLGSGLPSFWSIKSKEIDLDLGLSGWSANDWASQTKFSMMSNTEKVTDQELTRVSAILKQSEGLTPEQIMEKSGFKIKRLVVTNALQQLCSGGRAMFDFHKQIYRWRELFPEALMPKVEQRNPRIEKAQELLKSNRIRIDTKENKNDGLSVRGCVSNQVLAPHSVSSFSSSSSALEDFLNSDSSRKRHSMQLDFNLDGRVVDMECTCYEFKKTSLRKGPCHHLIALMQHIENEAQEIEE